MLCSESVKQFHITIQLQTTICIYSANTTLF